MTRRPSDIPEPREKRTLIPSFDPEDLAKAIEEGASRTTTTPPFDPACYARIVDEGITESTPCPKIATLDVYGGAENAAREAKTWMPPRAPATPVDPTLLDDPDTAGREMYGSYLTSDFPSALALAERVLDLEPDHALARLVLERCRERLGIIRQTLSPKSVLRLRMRELERHSSRIDPTSSFVLGHIDGISDAGTVAALTGLPNREALSRLLALVDLGVVEVVNG